LKIVITGASGQDGMFLIDNILNNTDAKIYACTRKKSNFQFEKLKFLNNNFDSTRMKLVEINFQEYNQVHEFIKDTRPDFVFNMMGPSSVSKFIENPEEMTSITINGFKNLTDSLIETRNFCNFYQASSSEMYGYDSPSPFNELSEFKPNTAYAKAKHSVHLKSIKYQMEYEWNIVSGIMFNHESEFRNSNFLIMKLIEKTIEIQENKKIKIDLPSLEISRDWSYAKDICNGIFQLTIDNFSGSYVLGSGVSTSIKDIAEYIFKKANLDYRDFINLNNKQLREGEPMNVVSDPEKIKKETGWQTNLNTFEVLDRMYDYKILNKT
tara:strand:- start:6529 stop:7500 length:972 start_codon:yes stop_codon:yes gene_type:complete